MQVPPQGLPAFKGVNNSSKFTIIGKLTYYSFKPCIQIVYEDVEEHWTYSGAMQQLVTDLMLSHHSNALCAQPMRQLLTHHVMCLLS